MPSPLPWPYSVPSSRGFTRMCSTWDISTWNCKSQGPRTRSFFTAVLKRSLGDVFLFTTHRTFTVSSGALTRGTILSNRYSADEVETMIVKDCRPPPRRSCRTSSMSIRMSSMSNRRLLRWLISPRPNCSMKQASKFLATLSSILHFPHVQGIPLAAWSAAPRVRS